MVAAPKAHSMARAKKETAVKKREVTQDSGPPAVALLLL